MDHRRRRFHFHQEEDREKKAMMQLIADEAMEAHALVVSPCPGKEREATRQRMLVELAATVARRPAVELTIESREPHNDRLDRMSLIEARRDGVIPQDMAYVHRQPVQEPLLWLADGLAGAVRSGSLLKNMTWLRLLPHGLVTIRRLSTTDLRNEEAR